MIGDGAEVVLVPVGLDGTDCRFRFFGESAFRVALQILLILFAARIEVERLLR